MTSIEKMIKKNPLILFSHYTSYQCDLIEDLGKKIIDLLDASIDSESNRIVHFEKIYNNFWLWTLGAYEVTRTMHQAKNCFSEEVLTNLGNYKRFIATIRIPFAKQEFARKKEKIKGDGFISGINTETKDFHFNIRGEKISIREMITGFIELISGIKPEDILGNIGDF